MSDDSDDDWKDLLGGFTVELPPLEDSFDRHDKSVTPPPVHCCRCGRDIKRQWIVARTRGFWGTPDVDPCKYCAKDAEEDEALAGLMRQQKIARLPRKLWPWNITRWRYQPSGLDVIEFQKVLSRTNAAHKASPLIGVLKENQQAFSAASMWKPSHGSGYLCGPVGSGKTITAAALCSDILQPQDPKPIQRPASDFTRWSVQPGPSVRTAYVVPPSYGTVLWTSEDEAFARETASWKGDKTPVFQMANCDVLFYDDLGSLGSKNQAVLRMVQRLVSFRYDHAKPTFFTSNLHWDELAKGNGEHTGFGLRIADRILEMCSKKHRWEFGSDERLTWRRVEA